MIGTACRCGRKWCDAGRHVCRPYGDRRWEGMRLLSCTRRGGACAAETIIAQMSEVRVTKWSLFGDEFSNHLREENC